MPHYAVFALCAWGHCRPELVLATRLVRQDPLMRVTLFLPEMLKELYDPELAKCGLDEEQKRRLEVVEFPLKLEGWAADQDAPKEDDETFKKFCNMLGQELVLIYEAWLRPLASAPDVLLVDILLLYGTGDMLKDSHRRLNFGKPKVAAIAPLGFAFTALIMHGLETPFVPAVEGYIQDTKKGMADKDAFNKHIVESNEKFLPALGVDMYLWECDPNESSRLSKHMRTWSSMCHLADPADFVLSTWPSPSALRPKEAPLLPVYDKIIHIGPQLLPNWRSPRSDNKVLPSGAADPVDTFLNHREPASVLYVAFGSKFYPPSVSQTRVLLDVLDHSGLGMLMVTSPTIDEESLKLIENWSQAGKGLLVPWTDQVYVLGHKAIAGFLSHGGSNSAIEGMVEQVPMVIWPGAWDQPYIANELDCLGVAHELVQVRTGHNIGKTTAKGVKITGTDEAVRDDLVEAIAKLDSMRERCRVVGAAVIKDMEKGEAHDSMMRLLNL